MRKVIIIGNGFDRAHNLKSSYGDFIKFLVEESINHNNEIRENFFDVGYMNTEEMHYEYISDNFLTLVHTKEENIAGRIRFKNQLLCTMMSKFFDADWVDVEEVYYKELCNFNRSHHNKYGVIELNEEFKKIKNCLEDYLLTEINGAKLEIIPNLRNLILHGNPESLIIICFNYTPVTKMYFDSIKEISDKHIVYIHGELKSRDNPIIFGYGDETDSNHPMLMEFSGDSYLENLKRSHYKLWDAYDSISEFLNKGQFNTLSIGHSLGKSDKTLLQEIFEHQNSQNIKLAYRNNRDSFKKLSNNLSKIISQSNLNTKLTNFRKSPVLP